jgi:DNA-binding transcriptional MerR regulator
MRDLVRESGLPRETIHFYLARGLLPPPEKTGRNTALYGREHVERLRKIRELREQQFLPLRAIKAIFADAELDEAFTPAQRELVWRIRGTLHGRLGPRTGGKVVLRQVAEGRVPEAEIRELERAGVIEIERSGRIDWVTEEDAQVIEAWASLKDVGVSPARGFAPRHMKLIDEGIERLVREEAALFTDRYADVSGEEAARIVARTVPIVNRLLPALHRKKMRRFFGGTATGRPGRSADS